MSEPVCLATPNRYDHLPYRRSGRSGMLPAICLGLWKNVGGFDALSGPAPSGSVLAAIEAVVAPAAGP